MPFPPGPFDHSFESSFPNTTTVSNTDREWISNLFNFSRVPWDVLFIFGLFTAILGFLIAHWWLTQRMRKYKDRIRIIDHEEAVLDGICPLDDRSFPSIARDVYRDPIPVKSEPMIKLQPTQRDVTKQDDISVPEEGSTRVKEDDVTIVPSPEPTTIVVTDETTPLHAAQNTEKKKGGKGPSRGKKSSVSKPQEKSEKIVEATTAVSES